MTICGKLDGLGVLFSRKDTSLLNILGLTIHISACPFQAVKMIKIRVDGSSRDS